MATPKSKARGKPRPGKRAARRSGGKPVGMRVRKSQRVAARPASKGGSHAGGAGETSHAKGPGKISSRAARKPARPSPRMEELRRMLESKRAEILRDIKRAREDGIETDRVSFPEVGDLVSASVEKERAFEHSELGVNALREIDNALEKLQEGTYGVCELCSRPIGIKRLRVMPSARLCIRCKSEQEASSVKNPPGR